MALFEKLHAEGNTIIVVTHEHEVAERAHRIITIRDGQIEKDEKIR
jgi:putative ABC transport system ATP-binding protein